MLISLQCFLCLSSRLWVGALRGYMVSDRDDAIAEAFAVGAMQYSFMEAEALQQRTDGEDDRSPSAFGQLLQRAEDWL